MHAVSQAFDEQAEEMVWRKCGECYLWFKTRAGSSERICEDCKLEVEAKEGGHR
jgi:hypothetical protein